MAMTKERKKVYDRQYYLNNRMENHEYGRGFLVKR